MRSAARWRLAGAVPETVANRLTQLSKTSEIKKASHGYSTQPAPRAGAHCRLLEVLPSVGGYGVAVVVSGVVVGKLSPPLVRYQPENADVREVMIGLCSAWER
jgi:hypothetical protein